MINDNMKRFRKEKGISQEEMAVRLNVVRQTISKWENGLSVPDADILIRIAEILEVSVSQLLGIKETTHSDLNLSEELAKLNEQLATKNQREKLACQANRKRGLIISFSFFSMLLSLTFKNEIVSVSLVGICLLSAVIVLYRNLALLTSVTTDDLKIGILKLTTFFNIVILITSIALALLTAFDIVTFTQNGEKLFAMSIVSCVILFAGIVSPKLPYTRHTGLRLPWTIQDEETWNIAHRIISYISLPIVLLYITCTLSMSNFEFVTLFFMVTWIGIPAALSLVFFRRKMYGR